MMWVGSTGRSISWGASAQRRLACFARAAGPPPVAHEGHGRPAHEHVHHYKPSGVPVHLIVGLVAGGLAVIILVVGMIASRPRVPSLAEVRSMLGIPAAGLPVGFKVSQVDFMNQMKTPRHKEEDDKCVYLYYDIQEGTLVFVVDRGGWNDSGEARIQRMYVQ
ncbi:MAG: hypothetical protein FJ291_19230 [Planctomycetes bacterium]|nr:hypothetical protein [Planctomycetota bacterium]